QRGPRPSPAAPRRSPSLPPPRGPPADDDKPAESPPRASAAAIVIALLAGWGSHVAIDMLTHRSDGYPIFWPLSAYRFPTPISYWEPRYHGVAFSLACDGL